MRIFLLLLAASLAASPMFAQRGEEAAQPSLDGGRGEIVLTPESTEARRRFRLMGPLDRFTWLVASPQELDIRFTLPDGTIRTTDQIAEGPGQFECAYSDKAGGGGLFSFPAGHYCSIDLGASAAGVYEVSVEAKAELSGDVSVTVLPMVLGAEVRPLRDDGVAEISFPSFESEVFVDTPLVVSMEVTREGAPVAGAAIRFEMTSSQSSRDVVLLDDGGPADVEAGDGVYSGSYTPDAAGTLQVLAYAAIPGEPKIDRPLTGWSARVLEPPAKLLRPAAVELLDKDGDGKADAVAVTSEVDVFEEGKYAWSAYYPSPGQDSLMPHGVLVDERVLSVGRHRLSAEAPLIAGLGEGGSMSVEVEPGMRRLVLGDVPKILWTELQRQDVEGARPDLPPPSEVLEQMSEEQAAQRAEMLAAVAEANAGRPRIQLIQKTSFAGELPQLQESETAEPPFRLTGPAAVDTTDVDGDGRPDGLVFTAPYLLAEGVSLESAMITMGRKVPGYVEFIDREASSPLRIFVPASRLAHYELGPSVPVQFTVVTSAGSIGWPNTARTPALGHDQFSTPSAEVVSVTPSEVMAGEKVRLVVEVQGMDVQPWVGGGSSTRRLPDGSFETVRTPAYVNIEFDVVGAFARSRVRGAAGENSFYVDVEFDEDEPTSVYDVRVSTRGVEASLSDGVTVRGKAPAATARKPIPRRLDGLPGR